MIDSHCHLHHCEHDDAVNIIQKASESGLSDIIQVSTDPDSYVWAKELLKKELALPVHLSAGLYPTRAANEWKPDFDKIKKIVENDKPCAIGEIGIDLYRDKSYLDEQVNMMRAHMELAYDFKLPVILHCRNSWESLSKIVLDYRSKVKGVWHCFDGSYEQAMTLIDIGYYISLSGLITFKSTKELQETVKKLPLEKLLIETDSPYLSPTPLRGKKNQPSHIVHTFNFLSELKECQPKELEIILDNNTRTLFNI